VDALATPAPQFIIHRKPAAAAAAAENFQKLFMPFLIEKTLICIKMHVNLYYGPRALWESEND
jgi:hypothetical protein